MPLPLLAALLLASPLQEASGAPRLSEVPPADRADALGVGRRRGAASERLVERLHRWTALRVGMLSDEVAWQLGPGPRLTAVDAGSGARIASRELPTEPLGIDVAGGRVVVCGMDHRARVYEGAALEPRGDFPAGAWIDLTTDGARALTWGGELAGLRVVTVPDGEPLRELALELGELAVTPVRAAWDGAGEVVAAVDEDRMPWLWHDGEFVELPALRRVHSLEVDPRGRWLAIGDERQRVLVLDAASGAEVASLRLEGVFPCGLATRALAFDAEGAHLVASTGDHGTVQTWRTDGWESDWTHDDHGGNPDTLRLAIDERGERVWVSGMTRGTPAAFELATGRVLADLAGTGLEAFAPFPHGRTIAARREGTLVLLEPDGRARLERLELMGLGAVVSRADGKVIGDPAALPHVYAQMDDEWVRADRLAAREDR